MGILLIVLSFFILIGNEGQSDLNKVALSTVQISSETPNIGHIGKPVATTGIIRSSELLGDEFFLKPAPYIAMARSVDMYVWVERREVESKINVGGSETRKTTVTYSQKWKPIGNLKSTKTISRTDRRKITESADSSRFLKPENHNNPKPAIPNGSRKVSRARIGIYELDMTQFDDPMVSGVIEAFNENSMVGYNDIPTRTPIYPSSETLNLTPDTEVSGSYLYKSQYNIANPKVGDLRIRYAVFPANTTATVMGQLEANNRIVPYVHSNNHSLYRLFPSNRETTNARIEKEDLYFTWILRFVGFVMMWGGFAAIVEPINVVLDILPILGSMSRRVTDTVTMWIALSLTVTTIVVYRTTQDLETLAIACLVAFFGTLSLFAIQRRSQA
ncbi:TMEM43 family protein [Geitlerinema sp. CS-897]|nr:TMEM43 family protein [Geitlerinema sp. CS-897]